MLLYKLVLGQKLLKAAPVLFPPLNTVIFCLLAMFSNLQESITFTITVFTDAPRHLVPMLMDWKLCLAVFTMYFVALELNIRDFEVSHP
jgi:hypothetical protein